MVCLYPRSKISWAFLFKISILFSLTYHGDDGKEGYHPNINEYYVESDEEEEQQSHSFTGVNFKNVLCLDDVDMELTKEDKINFR